MSHTLLVRDGLTSPLSDIVGQRHIVSEVEVVRAQLIREGLTSPLVGVGCSGNSGVRWRVAAFESDRNGGVSLVRVVSTATRAVRVMSMRLEGRCIRVFFVNSSCGSVCWRALLARSEVVGSSTAEGPEAWCCGRAAGWEYIKRQVDVDERRG